MSVSFTFGRYVEDPQYGTVLVHGIDCEHSCPAPATCEDWAIYTWCDHAESAREACGCRSFDLDVSNANAHSILERLGYEVDPSDVAGDADPDEILGRAMLANVGRDDSGVAWATYAEPGCATMTDCGVAPGYFDSRMEALARLATEAKARGELVVWA